MNDRWRARVVNPADQLALELWKVMDEGSSASVNWEPPQHHKQVLLAHIDAERPPAPLPIRHDPAYRNRIDFLSSICSLRSHGDDPRQADAIVLTNQRNQR